MYPDEALLVTRFPVGRGRRWLVTLIPTPTSARERRGAGLQRGG
jgi:hypothetical protein